MTRTTIPPCPHNIPLGTYCRHCAAEALLCSHNQPRATCPECEAAIAHADRVLGRRPMEEKAP